MKKLILVLEDNADRREAMKAWLSERFGMYDHFFSDDPTEFLQQLRSRIKDVLVASLDHDLHERPDFNTDVTGMDVVDGLIGKHQPRFSIVLHTTNTQRGDVMQERLRTTGWSVSRVVPFDDLNWIPSEWHRAIKKAIQASALVETMCAGDDSKLLLEPVVV